MLLKFLPNKATLIALTIGLTVAFSAGWMVNGWRHDAKVKKAVYKALKEASKQNKVDIKLAKKERKKVEAIRKETQSILKKVQHAKLNNTRLDPDFIRLYNASL